MIINSIGNKITNITPIRNNTSFSALKNKENITVVSLKDADNLKYEVEYNKLSRLKNDVNIVGDDINVYFRPSINSTKVTGTAYNRNINLEYVSKGFNPNRMIIRGKIDNQEVDLKYNIMGNNVNIEGDVDSLDDNIVTLMNMLAKDFTVVVNNQITLATMIMLS